MDTITENSDKKPRGRPYRGNVTLQIRVPDMYVKVAEGMGMTYKKMLATQFEKMVCVMILTKRGDNDCEICENVVHRHRLVEEEFQKQLAELTKEEHRKNLQEIIMREFIVGAKGRGLSRGEAETEFGSVFPDRIWSEYGGNNT